MRSIAAYNRAKRHNGIARLRQRLRGNWQFPGSRHLHKTNVFVGAAILLKRFKRAFGKLFRDEFVEAANHYTNAQSRRIKRTLERLIRHERQRTTTKTVLAMG